MTVAQPQTVRLRRWRLQLRFVPATLIVVLQIPNIVWQLDRGGSDIAMIVLLGVYLGFGVLVTRGICLQMRVTDHDMLIVRNLWRTRRLPRRDILSFRGGERADGSIAKWCIVAQLRNGALVALETTNRESLTWRLTHLDELQRWLRPRPA